MKEFMIEDMTETDNEREDYLNTFTDNLKKRESISDMIARRNNLPHYHRVMKAAVWDTFRKEIYWCSVLYFLGEALGLIYTTFLFYIIEYVRKSAEETSTSEGVVLVVVFSLLTISQALIRNYQIYKGYIISVKIRKTLVSALYDKICKLNMKSLAQTNSGKLVTIVSGDI
jgi:ABC-type multidrug transport system fused ATPase/permease subunit